MSKPEVRRERTRKNDENRGENTTPPISRDVVSSDRDAPDNMNLSSSDSSQLTLSDTSLSELCDLQAVQDAGSKESLTSHWAEYTSMTKDMITKYKEKCRRLKDQNKKLKNKLKVQKDNNDLQTESLKQQMEDYKREKDSANTSLAHLCAELKDIRLKLHSEQMLRQEMEETLRTLGHGEFFPSHHKDKVERLQEELDLAVFMKDEVDMRLMEEKEKNLVLQKELTRVADVVKDLEMNLSRTTRTLDVQQEAHLAVETEMKKKLRETQENFDMASEKLQTTFSLLQIKTADFEELRRHLALMEEHNTNSNNNNNNNTNMVKLEDYQMLEERFAIEVSSLESELEGLHKTNSLLRVGLENVRRYKEHLVHFCF
ncbi:uncharacterized protein LOC144914298 [Branchiostoma floridae x Branchiostoma belcheri]